ncbi:hypothetical protein CGH21_19820 [Vibrio parahaemolyticus]|nr:hypothetical protein [Vibrio parahaemolyticus]TON01039.1 hypothetical protein CGH66_01160 [Vibrio parahaemolyticus]TON05800.1 hypothetical protein CGH67_15675 [Vibrio parahaemolyticus]TON16381.1 hypothetical protein CGH64_14625 [Vibrio parahaemolyticus]TON31967.1 hypothetical protein CGH59_18135 [Vibrio parahaemolyticus]
MSCLFCKRTSQKKHPACGASLGVRKKFLRNIRGKRNTVISLSANLFKFTFDDIGFASIKLILFMHFFLHFPYAFFNSFACDQGCDGQWNRHD